MIRLILSIASVVCNIALVGCAPRRIPSEPVDQSTLAEIQRAAPSLTCLMLDGPMYQEDGVIKFDLDRKGTATILPSGECLTAGHFFRQPTITGERVAFVIEGRRVDATILERQISSDRRQDYLRMAVTFAKPPDLVAQRLAISQRRTIRFDGGFKVRKGQTLFAVGFAGQSTLTPPLFGLEITVLPLAAVQGGDSGPLVLDHPTDTSMFGMSGGPILVRDNETGELVVIGIVIHGQDSPRFQRRLLFGCRLPQSCSTGTVGPS